MFCTVWRNVLCCNRVGYKRGNTHFIRQLYCYSRMEESRSNIQAQYKKKRFLISVLFSAWNSKFSKVLGLIFQSTIPDALVCIFRVILWTCSSFVSQNWRLRNLQTLHKVLSHLAGMFCKSKRGVFESGGLKEKCRQLGPLSLRILPRFNVICGTVKTNMIHSTKSTTQNIWSKKKTKQRRTWICNLGYHPSKTRIRKVIRHVQSDKLGVH